MHLGSPTISRFRSCANLTVCPRPDLTVLVGENNSGKSKVVDAIRLLTILLCGLREKFEEHGNFRKVLHFGTSLVTWLQLLNMQLNERNPNF